MLLSDVLCGVVAESSPVELEGDGGRVGAHLGEKLVEELLVLLTSLESRHFLSVLRASEDTSPGQERSHAGRIERAHALFSTPKIPESRAAGAGICPAPRAGTAPPPPSHPHHQPFPP